MPSLPEVLGVRAARGSGLLYWRNSARCVRRTLVIHEGGTTGQLYVLIEGRLEVIKGDTVVASIAEPGAVVGEMSVLLRSAPHCDRGRASNSQFTSSAMPHHFLPISRGGPPDRPSACSAAQCCHHYLADIMQQYAGHGDTSRWSAKSCRA